MRLNNTEVYVKIVLSVIAVAERQLLLCRGKEDGSFRFEGCAHIRKL